MNEADLKLWHGWRHRRHHDAFEALVRPHVAFLADFARRRGLSSADADDLVQQTLAELAAEKGDRPITVGLRGWLGRSLVLQTMMLRRASVRRARHEGVPRPVAPSSDQVADRDTVETCLAGLPAPQRQAVVLRYLHDMEYEEMAYLTGASVNACRLRVHKGITSMRTRVGSRVGALVGMLPLLAGRSEAALVKGALAKSTVVPLAVTGGVLAVKKIVIGAVVLACVASSFYMLGNTDRVEQTQRAETLPPASVPPQSPAAPDAEKKEEPKPVEPKPGLSQLKLMVDALGPGGQGFVAYAQRAEYLGDKDKIKWYRLDETRPDGAPTGFSMQGPKGLDVMPLVTKLPAVYVLRLRDSGFTDQNLEQIAHLRMLLQLDLSRSRITDSGLQHLLGMTELRSLHVSDTAITDEGLRIIGQLRSLRFLGIRDTRITDAGITHLKGLVNLESVSFAAPGTGDKSVAVLAQLPNINHMHLADIRVSDETLEQVARMPRLRRLRLEYFHSLKALAGARSVEDLNLSDAKFRGAELIYLRDMTSLKRLNLGETTIGADGLQHLARLTNLEDLNLDEVSLNDDSMRHLAGLTKLRKLRLDATGITDKGVKHLAGLTGLLSLHIDENAVTDASVEVLAGLKNLRYLDLKETRVSAEGLARLKAALPDCRIRKP